MVCASVLGIYCHALEPAIDLAASCQAVRAEPIVGTRQFEDSGGMLIFDKWACNTASRQVVFIPDGTIVKRWLKRIGGCEVFSPATSSITRKSIPFSVPNSWIMPMLGWFSLARPSASFRKRLREDSSVTALVELRRDVRRT